MNLIHLRGEYVAMLFINQHDRDSNLISTYN